MKSFEMVEIGSSTADAFAKNYGQMLGQASQNYGTLMGGASDAQSRVYDDLNNKYAGALTIGESVKHRKICLIMTRLFIKTGGSDKL